MVIVKNNSEILFIYDAKNSNPNGDMDDENKPRMDKVTKTNLVSDVRLKRYIRDYIKNFENNKEIFVDDDAKSAEAKYGNTKLDEAKGKWIDIRFFGLIPTQKNVMGNTLTGPIQFNWGYSLNKAELQKSKTITSKWADQKGIGKDFRIRYSLIAFNGSINLKNAEHTNLTNEDVNLFDKAMIKAIPLSRTRSKMGQWPRLYIRIEMKGSYFLKDLRELIKLNKQEINSIEEVKLDVTELLDYFQENKENINCFKYFKDKKLKIFKGEKIIELKKELETLNNSVEEITLM